MRSLPPLPPFTRNNLRSRSRSAGRKASSSPLRDPAEYTSMSIALCLLFIGALSTRFTSLSFITLGKRWARLHRHMPAAVGGTPLGTGLFGYFHQGGIIGKV